MNCSDYSPKIYRLSKTKEIDFNQEDIQQYDQNSISTSIQEVNGRFKFVEIKDRKLSKIERIVKNIDVHAMLDLDPTNLKISFQSIDSINKTRNQVHLDLENKSTYKKIGLLINEAFKIDKLSKQTNPETIKFNDFDTDISTNDKLSIKSKISMNDSFKYFEISKKKQNIPLKTPSKRINFDNTGTKESEVKSKQKNYSSSHFIPDLSSLNILFDQDSESKNKQSNDLCEQFIGEDIQEIINVINEIEESEFIQELDVIKKAQLLLANQANVN